MVLQIKKSSVIIGILAVILIGAENCFYLIDSAKINVAGVFNYQDIFLVLAFMWSAYVLYTYQNYPNPKLKYLPEIIGIVILAFLSSIQSQKLYGMTLVMGIRPQRFWIMWALLYIPISKLLYNKVITVRQLLKIILFAGICESILYIAQYILFDVVQFLYVQNNSRYGSVRFYFYNLLLRLFMWIAVDGFFHNKKKNTNVIYVTLAMIVLLIVGKMRMTSFATLLTLFIGVLLWKNAGKTKIITIMVGMVVALFLFNTEIVQDTLQTISAYLNGNITDTLLIRDAGRRWYMSSLREHPILGCGYISTLSYKAYSAAGMDRKIYLVDNGVYAFLFMYGGIGMLWLVSFWTKLMKDTWKLLRHKGIYFPFLFFLGQIIAAQTELHWYWECGFLITIFVVAMLPYLNEEELYDMKERVDR